MRTFQDKSGRTWTISVNVDSIKRVRDLLKEDLLDLRGTVTRLLVDPILLCDVIYCICKPQADAENISDVEFGRAMGGDSIAHAKAALMEELTDFFPEPKDREAIRHILKKHAEFHDQIVSRWMEKIDGTSLPPEIEAALSATGN